MSTKDCIDKIGLTPREAKELQDAENVQELLAQKKKDILRQKELIEMQKIMHEKLMAKVFAHPKGPVVGLRSVVGNDLTGRATWSNLDYRRMTIEGQAKSRMTGIMQELHTEMFGLKRSDKGFADDVMREIMGTDTANPKVKELARQWHEVAETLRLRFNKAGGDISKLDSWGLPQSHAQAKVFRAGREAWINYIRPLLRNADDVDLDYIYDTISTGGLNKTKSESHIGVGRKMTAKERQDPRVLHFKDGDSWTAYNKEFGNSDDPLSVMEDHIRGMSQDIAKMEIFGPNPDHMFATLNQQVNEDVSSAVLEVKRLKQDGQPIPPELKARTGKYFSSYTEQMYNAASGKVDESAAITVAGKALTSGISTARAFQTATKLGSATLSAVTDLGTLFVNAGLHGVSPFKVAKSMITNLRPIAGLDNQVQVARLGFALDVFNSSITKRFDEVGKGGASQMAEAVMRASGMNRWTEAARKAFQYEFYNHLSNLQSKSVRNNELPKIYKNYGWTKEQVQDLDFENLSLGQQTKLLEMVNQEGDYAVMMPNARTRAITTGGHKRGTAEGETRRTFMQFKSFPATFMIQQFGRVMFQDNMSLSSRIAYGSSLFVAATTFGAVAMMAKDKAKGYQNQRDGSPLKKGRTDWKDRGAFWSAAALQGGGAGIIGDLLFSDVNRFGGGVIPTLAGPMAGTVESAVKLTAGNVRQTVTGEDTNIASEAIDFVNREANPLNLFYTKAVIEMYVTDTLKDKVDPKYKKAKRRKARKRKKEYGQKKSRTLQELISFGK